MLVPQDNAGRVQGSVLKPCRIGVEMKMTRGCGDVSLSLSDLNLSLAPDIFELVQSLQSSVLEPLVQPALDRSVHTHAGVQAFLSCFMLCRPCCACFPAVALQDRRSDEHGTDFHCY